jgi:hypothetical protein
MSLSMIAIVNQSKRVTDAQLDIMCACISRQVSDDFAPAWGLLPVLVRRYRALNDIPGETDVAFFVLVDANTEVPGALGWHTEDGSGRVTGVICASPVLDSPGGVVLFDSSNPASSTTLSVASVLSHEVLETIADQFVNSWADGPPRAEGEEYAYEVCDPCEATAYLVVVEGVGQASVSDFVLPRFFDPDASGLVDRLGACPGPFELAPGGYYIVRSGPGTERQVFAESGIHRPWRKSEADKPGFRSQRRTA